MARPQTELWACVCGHDNAYDVEVCPECGRSRDFVLARWGEGNKPTHTAMPTREDIAAPPRKERPPSQGAASVPTARLASALGWARTFVWERHPGILKALTTLVLLAVIYYGTTELVAYLTAPRIVMTMSPIVGRIAVSAEPAKLAPIMRKVTYTGSVSPYEEVTVYPRVEGWVNDFKLYEGDHVKQGQVIARLDRAELGAALERQRAALEEAQRARDAAAAEIQVSEANILAARADVEFWTAEIRRMAELFKAKAVSEFEYDNAKNNYAAAKAKLTARQSDLAQARAKLRAAEDSIRRARAEQERVKTIYGYTDILAPISGRVSKRHIYAGILVKPGMPIVTLQDLSKARIQVRVAEQDAPYIQEGNTEAIVRFPSLPEPQNRYPAKVSTVFPELDPVTRTTTVEMVLDNPDGLIRTDMYAIVDLILEKKAEALTIPRQAVLDRPGQEPIVYVTDGVMAMSRPVKLGIAEGDRIEVLDGVQPEEMVVYKGQRSLTDGAQVNLVAGF